MAQRWIPAERPRPNRRFLTAREVEDMADANIREIVYSPDMIITDAARETAIDLGIRIVAADAVSPPAPPATPQPAVARLGTAPAPARAAAVPAAAATDDLVRALVDAIRTHWRPVKRYTRQLTGPEEE